MTFLEKLKEIGMFKPDSSLEDAVSFFYQNRIYISHLADEKNVPEELKKIAEEFLENDAEYDGDEAEAWKRLLNLKL